MTSPHPVTLVPGSGVGPQMAQIVREVVARAGVAVAWDEQHDIDGALASIARTRVALKGKWHWPPQRGVLPLTIRFRKSLGIHTIVRRVRNFPGVPARAEGVDLVIVREASEDIYAGFEHETAEGVFESVKVTTRAACERVHRYAFDLARREGRKKVTTVHKANILKQADGMFLRVGQAVAADFPGIEHGDVIVDALCMDLVRRPGRYDVLVCGNLFGDIVSDCAAGMAGGITVACGVNYGPDVAVFESPHTATEAQVGAHGGNPYPMLSMAVDLLHHLGEADAGGRVRAAMVTALAAGARTRDLGGDATCDDVRDAVFGAL